MKEESLYLDTSVPSAYYDKRAKERQDATIKFWKEVLPNYKVYVSEITVGELEGRQVILHATNTYFNLNVSTHCL